MKSALRTFLCVLFGLLVTLLLVADVHCSTSTSSHNSLGALTYNDNPNRYIEGAVIAESIHEDNKRVFTTLRVQPTHTYGLFTEELTFCGDQAEMFNGVRGPVVITFSKTMHHTWCYDLYSVHQVAEKKLQ